MSWHTGALCAFDLETTGVDVAADRIVTACVARVDGAGRDMPSVATWLANPGVEIPAKATEIHGVTTEHAKAEGQDAEEVVAETAAMLVRAMRAGVPVVGFNLRYDLSLLDSECRRYGLPTVSELTDGRLLVVCGRVLDKWMSRRSGPRKLQDVCQHWGVPLEQAHNATADAIAAARLVVTLAGQNRQLQQMTLPELHVAQVGWHREQCLSHAAAKRRQLERARTTDEQLRLQAFAESLEAEAEYWPVAPPVAAQERLG